MVLTHGGGWVSTVACWFEEPAISLPLSPHVFLPLSSLPQPPDYLLMVEVVGTLFEPFIFGFHSFPQLLQYLGNISRNGP